MREAVERAFRQVTGHDNEWMFSGWGADLSEAELAVTEDRLPRPRVIAAAARAVAEQAGAVIGTDLDPEAPERGWEIHEPDDRLRIELTQLRRWKAEAMTVLGEWDKVHAALGKPGQLGESMALASLAEINPLIAAPPAPAVPVGVCEYIVTGDEGTSYCSLAEQSRLPVEQAGRRIEDLPEWAALVEAVNDDGGTVANYRATVTGRAASLTRAVRALAAAPSPATEPGPPNKRRDDWVAIPAWLAAAPAVSPEPERDGPLNAYEDTDGPSGEDAVRERQYERDHGIEP